jgi:hypothetical protein
MKLRWTEGLLFLGIGVGIASIWGTYEYSKNSEEDKDKIDDDVVNAGREVINTGRALLTEARDSEIIEISPLTSNIDRNFESVQPVTKRS